MGCYFYTQDRGVHTLGEEIRRRDMGLWPLLSRMYQVSCEAESHEMHLFLHNQVLRVEIQARDHGPMLQPRGSKRNEPRSDHSITWATSGRGGQEPIAHYVQKAWLRLAVSCLPDRWSSEPATLLCVPRWERLPRAVQHHFLCWRQSSLCAPQYGS